MLNYQQQQQWTIAQLSIDQKPDRQDQKQNILKNGGRVDHQKDQFGKPIGPLRVWMSKLQMPGLAMTRSFGDKIGMQAGTNGQPQIFQFPLLDKNKLLVVASDGVWQYVTNQQVKNVIIPFYTKGNIQGACQKLLNYSVSAWKKQSISRDDITAIIVSINSL